MATLRTYGDRCAVARALDLVGERWALLVVRELLLGPKRFTDLQAGMPNAKPSVLSQRLRELEEGGVVQHRKLGPPAGTSVYELTDLGGKLEPILAALGRWGSCLPVPSDTAVRPDSLVLALKWRFDPDAAGDVSGDYELRLAEHRFRIQIRDGRIDVRRGDAEAPDAIIETDQETFEAVMFGGREPAEAMRARDLSIEGDQELATRLLDRYAEPQSAIEKGPRAHA
jgi:DNA-binding HxlR family transcriptional regulator/putative sterol carrier protein